MQNVVLTCWNHKTDFKIADSYLHLDFCLSHIRHQNVLPVSQCLYTCIVRKCQTVAVTCHSEFLTKPLSTLYVLPMRTMCVHLFPIHTSVYMYDQIKLKKLLWPWNEWMKWSFNLNLSKVFFHIFVFLNKLTENQQISLENLDHRTMNLSSYMRYIPSRTNLSDLKITTWVWIKVQVSNSRVHGSEQNTIKL